MATPAKQTADAADGPTSNPWPGRVLFFVVGVAAAVAALPLAAWTHPVIALAAPYVGGVLLMFQRHRRGPRWRWASYVVGVTTVWLNGLVLGLVLLTRFSNDYLPEPGPFAADQWKSAQPGRGGTRGRMVDDLLKRPLVGMKIADVDALLGADDSVRGTGFGRGYFDEFDRVWWLGPERGPFSIDSEWLVLRVDASGVVTEAELVTD